MPPDGAGAAPARAPRAAQPAPTRRRRLRVPAPLVLLSPFALLFAAFYVLPIVWALRTSLYVDRLIGGEHFVGTEAYSRALKDPAFWEGFKNVGLLTLVQVPLSIVLALVFAFALDGRSLRGKSAHRLIIFLPYAVPTVIAGLMWGFMYDRDLGPLQSLFGSGAPDLLSPSWIVTATGNIMLWGGTGVAMVVFYAALKAIPAELEEAAAVDGARKRDVVRDIKLPLLAPSIGLILLISVITTLQVFNEPAVLHTLAPQSVGNSFSPNYYAYTLTFKASEPNYAAALAFVLAAVVVVVSYGGMALGRLRRRS